MCRGSNLGTCCAQGCDEQIRCQDTGGYCNEHDPFADLAWDPVDEDAPETEDRPPVVDDPEKRRTYTLARLTEAIERTQVSIRADQHRLSEMRSRMRELEELSPCGLTSTALGPASRPSPPASWPSATRGDGSLKS